MGVVVSLKSVTVPCTLKGCPNDATVAAKVGDAKAVVCTSHVALWLREQGVR